MSYSVGQIIGQATSVKTPHSSIEGVVIEKKENLFNVEKARARFENRSLVIINNTEYLVNGELVLPKQITELIDNPMWLPRYKKLAKVHGVNYLLKLAELAKTKNHYKPSRWFAKCCSVEKWKNQTLDMLQTLFKQIDEVKEKLKDVRVGRQWLPYYLKAYKKLSQSEFNDAVELAKGRHVDKPPNMLAKAIKKALAGEQWQPAT